MPEKLTDLLRQELRDIERRMQEFATRKQAILNVLNTYDPAERGNNSVKGKLLPMQPLPTTEELSTLDMAQRVIEKHGEMKAEQIMEAIRQEFEVKPAHTLPQMLYIRARAKKRFYRSPGGKFGLIESSGRKKQTRKTAA